MHFWFFHRKNKVITTLKRQMKKCGGKTAIPTLRGGRIDIRLAPSRDGIETSGLKGAVLRWEEFAAIVTKANELGGTMYRGDSAARNGAKIGSDELPPETIDGFVSTRFYGAAEGDTTQSRSTYYAGILDWAGIAKNHISEGKGGYITIQAPFRKC